MHHEVMGHPMPPFALPLPLFPPVLFTPAPAPAAGPHLRILAQASPAPSLLLFAAHSIFTMHNIEDAFIGLSCIAIAATLASFLTAAGRDTPLRWPLTALTLCTTLAGLCCLLSAAPMRGEHPALTGLAPLFGAVLAILAAFLLPFLLPLLLSRSRELEFSAVAARKNENRFLAATQSSSDAFILLEALRSPDGTIEDFLFTYINVNAEKIIEKPGSEVVGARITRILPIDPAGRLFRQYCEVVATGKPLVHEFPLDPKDPDGPWMRHHVARLGEDSEAGLAITASDITERKHAQQDRLHLSQHDPLTGLPNRRLLDDRIQQAIARADRYGNKVAVILVSLDSFEQINAGRGSDLGDQVLLATAIRLRGAVRATDSVLRLGGDEFVVLMGDMLLEIDIRRAAATLVAILREPLALEDKTGSPSLQVSTSLGVAVYPDTALTVDNLLTHADSAMYRAKIRGSNQYVLNAPAANLNFGADPGFDADPALDSHAPAQQYAG
jgi:diguanylate cyclase (GGDEF)-like protein